MNVGETYQHFKGGLYEITGIVGDSIEAKLLFEKISEGMPVVLNLVDELAGKTRMTVYDAMGDELVERVVAHFVTSYHFLDEEEPIGAGVLYQSLSEDVDKVFFRTFDNFFELINREDYPISPRFQRFSN